MLSNMEKQRLEKIEQRKEKIENKINRKYPKKQLEWMQVHSNHDNLKPYLRQKLLENIQNPDTEIY